MTTHKIIPSATIIVPESEKKDYEYTGMEIVTIPDEYRGLGPVRNWVLNKFKEEIIVADDDIKCCYCVTGKLARLIKDTETIYQIIYQAAVCAKDLGTAAFGFNQAWDVRKYKPTEPFSMVGWAGGLIGVVGRDIQFMEEQKFRVDVDFFLENLLKKRVIWKDERFSFCQIREKNAGGNSNFRTTEELQKEIRKLKNKWGEYFTYKTTKTGENTKIKVIRKSMGNI